jgi:hypothetical protein
LDHQSIPPFLLADYVDNVDAEGAGFIRRFAAGLHGSSSLREAPPDAGPSTDRLESTYLSS